MVEIKEVKTRRERIEFIRFPKSIYSDCPYWTPDLVFDELENLTPEKNTAFGFCEARFFMAYRDGKAVGPHRRYFEPPRQRKMEPEAHALYPRGLY